MSKVNNNKKENRTSPESREINMDLLRIAACLMVVILHASAQNWHVTEVNSGAWKVFNLYDTAVRSCVPLFIMLSGKLFLGKKDISISKLYQKNIWKLIVIYFFWSLLYALDTVGIANVFDAKGLWSVFEHTIDAKYHLWYLPSLISIYFLLPILWGGVHCQKGRFLKYMCIMFFCFGVIRKSILIFIPDNTQLNILFGDFTYALNGLCGYFVMGYALDKYKNKFTKVRIRYLIILYTIIVLISAKIGECNAVSLGEPNDLLYGHFALPVFLEAMIIFIIFLKLPEHIESALLRKMIRRISKYTLFIYLVHVFVLEHIKIWIGLTTCSFNAWISVPIIAVLVFCISLILAAVFDKVPFFKKWFM